MRRTINHNIRPWIFWIIAIIATLVVVSFSSCSTRNLTKNTAKRSSDSTHKEIEKKVNVSKADSSATTVTKDTTNVVEEETKTTVKESGWDVIDVDSGAVVTFPHIYNTADPDDYFQPVVVTKPNGKQEVYVPKKKETSTESKKKTESKGSTSTATTTVNKSDSGATEKAVDVHVKKQEKTKVKDVKSNLPAIIMSSFIILFFLLLIYLKRRPLIKWIKRIINPKKIVTDGSS